MKKRTLALLMAVVMLLGVTVGGTIAWLTATATEVKNTFTVGDVAIKLYETDNNGTETQTNEYQLVPGNEYKKDPKVEVLSDTNVDCYLFVKFTENEEAKKYLNYESTLTSENGWKKLIDDVNGEDDDVWYRTVSTTDSTKSWYLLGADSDNTYANGYVGINSIEVTKATMSEADAAELKWNAFAVQKDNLSVAEAWALVDPTK